jgi:hypothetical protein
MHHIALYALCIALLLVSHTWAFCDRPRGAATRAADGVSSLTYIWIKANPNTFNQYSLPFIF